MATISVAQLYQNVHLKLKIKWVAGLEGGDKLLSSDLVTKPSLGLIGHLNFIHPNRVQVLGCAEMDYLMHLTPLQVEQAIANLFATEIAVIIVANGELPPQALIEAANQHDTALFTTDETSPNLMMVLSHYLSEAMAESAGMYGVFMEVSGSGVLLTGDSAIGKSELALDLITRGHRLVADDVVDFYRIRPDFLEGRCPGLLQDFLEVRGLGILNIRDLFGSNAIQASHRLDLIVHLAMADTQALQQVDRLKMQSYSETILGVAVPKVVIPVVAGRNIAVLVEVAVRNHVMQRQGINSVQQFTQRQRQALRRSRTDNAAKS